MVPQIQKNPAFAGFFYLMLEYGILENLIVIKRDYYF